MGSVKKLAVIDGKSVFYRGYYAMPTLATGQGQPTGGVYGFAVLALQVLKKLNPDYVIVAWDKSKTNIRSRRKLYAQYKANRKPMPDDLREQIPILRQLLEGFNWPLLELDDYEADDIMATLAKQARGKKIKTILVTSDLDVLQAVDDDTDVCALKRGLTNIVMYTKDKFVEEYGMTPEQFIDYKALKGDSSDNVPGVAGIGDKTAKDLIKQFGTLEGVYKKLPKIPEKLRAKLETDRDMAFLSHKLLEIKFDAPVKLDLKAADVTEANPTEIADLFRKLEFRRLVEDLPPQMRKLAVPELLTKTSQIKLRGKVETITTKVQLEMALKNPRQAILTLTEVSPASQLPEPKELIIAPTAAQVYRVVDPKLFGLIPKLLESKELIGYHLKNDLKAWSTPTPKSVFDVMVAAFVINPLLRLQNLADLALDELEINFDDNPQALPTSDQTALQIGAALWGLYNRYQKQLAKVPTLHRLANDIEFPIIPVLARIEHFGVKLDTKYLDKMSVELTQRINEIQKLIFKEAGQEFNISSPAQLAMVLFDKLALPTKGIARTKTGYSTAAPELDKLRGLHPIINLISEYRELTKLKSTYVDTLPKQVDKQSRLHTTFNQTVAQTGRLSSDKPNLQNIPIRSDVGKQIRKGFIAEPDNLLISADYSQNELRMAAVLANDTNMIHAFNKGIDIHAMTAAELYDVELDMITSDMRRAAKTVNFGVLYGLSAHGLSVATGMSRDKAKEFIDRYFKIRQKLLKYLESLKKQAHEKGYVETLFGRRRPMPDVHSSNWVVRAAAERAAMNMPIQGTAADLTKMAMIEIDKKLDKDCRMTLQIHDSILVEVPKTMADRTAKLLKTIMEGIHKMPVELKVDVKVGSNWGEL